MITRTTKKGCNAKNFLVACFFCDKTDSADNLNECRTLYLDMRVRKIAHDSNNSQLIAKLSEGEMVATEAKYHHACLTKLYNQYRSINRNRSKEMNELELIKGIALSKLFAFIEDSIDSNDSIPVFLLKELKKFYQERFERNNAPEDFVKNVHSARLILKILEEIPGLREDKQGKDVVLTVDGEMGRAVFEACQYSSQDDGFILAKAAKIIRKDLFEKYVSFNGDLSINKAESSYPFSLKRLIMMILEVNSVEDIKSTKTSKIANNISQIIRFNAVKHRRKQDVTVSRHSAKSEPPLPVSIGLMVYNKTRKKKDC